MSSFQLIFLIISFIPLANTIIEDDILYDIQWQPPLTVPIELENNFVFTSKRKEKYNCALPIPQTTVTTSPETILFNEVEPFFQRLHNNKPCVYRMDPYWTYEFCHGTHIRQYHETLTAGKKVITQEYFLGYYHTEHQDIMTNADNQSIVKIHYKTVNHQKIPMLSVRYTGGTSCDINSNTPRETVVYYICNEQGTDNILNFQEISSCYYEMTVVTSRLCYIPAFREVESNQHTINCYPQENALQKPRNLKKLEQDRYLTSKIAGGGAQFTMTSADGTTFIISYEYVNQGDLKQLTNNLNPASTTPTPPVDNNNGDFFPRFLSGEECLTGGTGWWRYELCYGKHVIQFHDEGAQRSSILLGKWNREKHIEWATANPKRKSTGNTKQRQYIPLYYTDGDQCELTKTSRTVEVKLRCSRGSNTSLPPSMYLVEPESCAYVLGVESPLFCNLDAYTDEHGILDEEKLIKR